MYCFGCFEPPGKLLSYIEIYTFNKINDIVSQELEYGTMQK